jgi:hypothetical protein
MQRCLSSAGPLQNKLAAASGCGVAAAMCAQIRTPVLAPPAAAAACALSGQQATRQPRGAAGACGIRLVHAQRVHTATRVARREHASHFFAAAAAASRARMSFSPGQHCASGSLACFAAACSANAAAWKEVYARESACAFQGERQRKKDVSC